MNKFPSYIIRLLLIFSCLSTSCSKIDNWLDVKVNKSDVIPESIKDYQAIMDNENASQNPNTALVGCDNSYATTAQIQSVGVTSRNVYIFAPTISEDATTSNPDWNLPFAAIERSNIVLEGIVKIETDNSTQLAWNNVKGSALFVRALCYYNLLQIFAKPYNKLTANTDLGLPIRLSSDININSQRATVEETYMQVVQDITEALPLLPDLPQYQTRPSKAAAFGLLARLSLDKGEYLKANDYADQALKIYNTLIDFNTLSTSASLSFPAYPNNSEIIFYSYTNAVDLLLPSTLSGGSFVDSTFFKQYVTNDLRMSIFYRTNTGNTVSFKGQYTGRTVFFGGIATNELFLIRAESAARNGNVSAALSDLNSLLIKRWKNSANYVPVTATSPSDALSKILAERRKELPFTGQLRWSDLRRLNTDPQFAKSVVHLYNNGTYSLAPNDPKYVFDIPLNEIQTSALVQNVRK
jgi:hypothetical protein